MSILVTTKLLSFFKVPRPPYSTRVYFRTISIIAAIIFLMLWVFTPFNFNLFPPNRVFVYALVYAGSAYATMLLGLVWIKWFPKLFAAESWNVGREALFILYQVTTIAATVWCLGRWLVDHPDAKRSFGYIWSIIAASSVLPYLVATLLNQTIALQRKLAAARREYQQRNLLATVISGRKEPLVLPGLLVPVFAEELLYIKSEGNNLAIYAEKEGGIQCYTVRATLKQVLADNVEVDVLFRCHRTYVINIAHVASTTKTTAGYSLTFRPSLPAVPVSRTHAAAFEELACRNNLHETSETPIFEQRYTNRA